MLTMAMAGMGLSVEFDMFKRMGFESLSIGLIGSLIVSMAGFLAILALDF